MHVWVKLNTVAWWSPESLVTYYVSSHLGLELSCKSVWTGHNTQTVTCVSLETQVPNSASLCIRIVWFPWPVPQLGLDDQINCQICTDRAPTAVHGDVHKVCSDCWSLKMSRVMPLDWCIPKFYNVNYLYAVRSVYCMSITDYVVNLT